MACSSSQVGADDLAGAVAAVEDAGQQAGDLLLKATATLTSLHSRLLPEGQPPASLGELTKVLGPDSSVVDDFRCEHTVCGLQTTLLMLLGHGFEGDFDKAMSGLPRGPDGKPVALGDFANRSHELAKKLTETLEAQVAKRAGKAKEAKKLASTQ